MMVVFRLVVARRAELCARSTNDGLLCYENGPKGLVSRTARAKVGNEQRDPQGRDTGGRWESSPVAYGDAVEELKGCRGG